MTVTARRTLLVLAATAISALAAPAVPAFAGGGHGCDVPATSADGDVVEIANGCFNPTTLQVRPGDAVTFVNLDPFGHNVSAVGWGHLDALNEGESFQATFDEAGVYPYACQYHAGMTGAIVVGDGAALADGKPVVSDTGDADVVAAETVDAGSGATTGWVAGGAIGLAAGIAVGALARRRSASS